LIVHFHAIDATRRPPKNGSGQQPMSDYAATARKYIELAERAADPELAAAYRNLAAGYELLAHGTELLHRHDEPVDES
jgi:hypothetical protein